MNPPPALKLSGSVKLKDLPGYGLWETQVWAGMRWGRWWVFEIFDLLQVLYIHITVLIPGEVFLGGGGRT